MDSRFQWAYGLMGSWVHGLISPSAYKLISLLCISCLASSAYADVDMHILPGFDSYHKNGRWLPLRITLASVDEDMAGEVTVAIQDSATEARWIYSVPIVLSKATKKVQYLYVLPESFRRNLHVRLTDKYGKEVLRRDTPLTMVSPEELLIVVIARSGGGLEFLADASEQGAPSKKIYVSYSTAELLPDNWKGYDSVDMIVLGDVSTDAFSADQRMAITDWVYGGGMLVVSGGAYSQNLMGTFVEELLPVRINGTRVLDRISSLSQQSGTRIVVASSELTGRGRAIAAEEDGLPMIAEREVGDGKVVFLAFDYLDPALRAWSGKIEMWKRLFPEPVTRERPENADIVDLLFATRYARLPSYKFVGFFLVLYVLCFGPLNYLVLRRSKRGGWAWITMPAIAAAFTIGSLGFTYIARSQAAVVNDLSVVDIHQDAERAHVNSYFSLFSPAKPGYGIKFPASGATFVSRMPSPDRRIRQDGDLRLVEKEIFQMEILHTGMLSPQSFYGESYVDLSGNVSINLSEDSEGVTQGKMTSNLPFDLTDCYVFSGERYAYIGNLTRGSHAQFRLDRARVWSIPGLYSSRGGEKRRFINAMKPSLSRRVTGTGVIGWMKGSALKTLVEMDMGEDYKSQGTALVIVHL